MIQFGLHTYRAEINAMPCPPDKFEIVVTNQDKLYGRIDVAQFKGYDLTIKHCQLSGSDFLVYTRFKAMPPKTSVQDLILLKMKTNNERLTKGHRRR